MNNFPEHSSEKAPVDRQEVINRLKDYGLEDQTTKELLIQWEEQVRLSIKSGTGREEKKKLTVKTEIEIAQMYAEAGLIETALDTYENAYEFANNAGEYELCEEIQVLANNLQ